MTEYSYGGYAYYRIETGERTGGLDDTPGTVAEDPNPDHTPVFGTINDILEPGEETIYDGGTNDYNESYAGTATIDGHTMIVTNWTDYYYYIYTPPGVDPNDINWPDNLDEITIVVEDFALCFAAGTRITTLGACAAVEDLQIGDVIATADGRATPVKWIGRQTLHKLFLGPHIQPVRIRAGALGDGLPHSDLTVTADHGMIIDGLVINASALVNGDTIEFVPMDELEDSLTVYHIETEDHDVIFANGAPAETFVDAVTRSHFDNYQEYLNLYGAEHLIVEMSAPRISSQRLVPQAIRQKLAIGQDEIEMDLAMSA